MRHLTEKLGEFLVEAKPKALLTASEERLFRSLKTQGERATKGREISSCLFEAHMRDGALLLMKLEGRHAISVGRQVSRRFEESAEVASCEVVKTKDGACVVLRAKEPCDS